MTDSAQLERPGTVLGLAALGLAASAIVAVRRPIPRWETGLTSAINAAPELAARATWPAMQFGSFVAPIVIGGVALVGGHRRLAGNVIIAGLGAWGIAKGIKELVRRERPSAHLADLVVRDGDASGLGYLSGHSAVAAACATCLVAALPARWRPVAVAAAGVVGVARIVHGMHFPADVIGGWSLGVILGVVTISVSTRAVAAT